MNSSTKVIEGINDYILDKLTEMHREARQTMEWTRELLDCGFEVEYEAWLTLYYKDKEPEIITYKSESIFDVIRQAFIGCVTAPVKPDHHSIEVFVSVGDLWLGKLPEEYYREYL